MNFTSSPWHIRQTIQDKGMNNMSAYKCRVVKACVIALFLVNPEFTQGFNNNGWETDYVYACQRKGNGGQIHIYTETGTFVSNLTTTGTNWWSLTFAGLGNNDARL